MNKKSNQELASLIIIFVFSYSVMVFLLNHFLKPMMARRVEGVYMGDNPPEWWENPPENIPECSPGACSCEWWDKVNQNVYGRDRIPPSNLDVNNFQKCCRRYPIFNPVNGQWSGSNKSNCNNPDEVWPEPPHF